MSVDTLTGLLAITFAIAIGALVAAVCALSQAQNQADRCDALRERGRRRIDAEIEALNRRIDEQTPDTPDASWRTR